MIEDALEERGYSPAQIAELVELIEQELTERSLPYAAELVHRIFVRVDRDSVAGRALSRALGFTSDQSLARAARDFGVTKQYLHRLEADLRARCSGLGGGNAPTGAPKNAGPSARAA